MKVYALLPALLLAGVSILAFPVSQADARGGISGNYARAYCEHYRNMAAMAARDNVDAAMTDRQGTSRENRNSPQYWRTKYRECLKEYGGV